MMQDNSSTNNHLDIFLYFLRKYKWRVPLVITTQLFTSLLEGIGIIALFPLITLVIENESTSENVFFVFFQSLMESFSLSITLPTILCLICGLFVFKALLSYVAAIFVADLSSRVVLDFRLKMFNGFLNAQWPFYIRTPAGFINSLFTESQRAGGAFSSIMDLIANLLQICVLASLAFLASWKIVSISILIGGFLWVTLSPIIRSSRQSGSDQKSLSKKINARISDLLHNLKPIKAMGMEKPIHEKVEQDIRNLFQAVRKQALLKKSLPIAAEPIIVIVISVGLYVSLNILKLDMASSFVTAALFYKIITSWNMLQQRYQALSFQEAFFWSVINFIEDVSKNCEKSEKSELQYLNNTIEFRDLSFSHENKHVLSDISFEIRAHKVTALLGPSGSGKTTVIDLICKLHTPSKGQILIDGCDLNQIDLQSWRSQIGYVSQEFVVFHDTLLENLTLGRPYTEEDAIKALEAAGAWEFAQDLPKGLHTILGEKGQKLSGGQRQRISIARALIGNPKLLIMDEATASLDPKTEKGILETLAKLKKQTTILIISHGHQVKDYADCFIDLGKKDN